MRAVAILLVLAASTSEGQVYRCTEGGRTVYADKPCGAADATVSVPVAPPPPRAEQAASHLQLLALQKRVAIGMTPAQVELAWGKPKSVHTRTSSRGRSEMWSYGSGGNTNYVHFDDGLVSSMSSDRTEESKPVTPPTPSTAIAVDDDVLVRAARAGARKFVREGESQDSVETRLGPPDARGYSNSMIWWTYAPQPKDYQTRTTVWFDGGRVWKVERAVER